jgi:hypothetical protein
MYLRYRSSIDHTANAHPLESPILVVLGSLYSLTWRAHPRYLWGSDCVGKQRRPAYRQKLSHRPPDARIRQAPYGGARLWTTTVTSVLVGRSSELEELHDIAERARSGGTATLVIRGEPGVGETVFPVPRREAIQAAFGLSATGRPDQFLVGLATLTLLGDPERTAPLFVVVDDAHWLFDESMPALAFVGRRLQTYHLKKVFHKVGVRSRIELAKAIADPIGEGS